MLNFGRTMILRGPHPSKVIARGDDEEARALVEDFANRDVSTSGDRARAWLRATYAKLEPLWQTL